MIAATGRGRPSAVQEDERLGECHYGDWTGQPLKAAGPGAAVEGGPGAPGAPRDSPAPTGSPSWICSTARCSAVRDWNERLGTGAVYLICSHGDVIKSVIADSLGMHIDMLQRIQVDPCSLTADPLHAAAPVPAAHE